jgi:hypothetical protein
VIKDEKPYISHKGESFRCYLAGYLNPVQHKWSFVIDGVDSDIKHNEKIDFMGMTLTVCFSLRRDAVTTKPFNNVTGKETYIEAWLV